MRNWLPIIVIAVLLLAWGQVAYRLIGDRPPAWDYGTAPYIPAQSIYSTTEPATGQADVERQIPSMGQAPNPPPGPTRSVVEPTKSAGDPAVAEPAAKAGQAVSPPTQEPKEQPK